MSSAAEQHVNMSELASFFVDKVLPILENMLKRYLVNSARGIVKLDTKFLGDLVRAHFRKKSWRSYGTIIGSLANMLISYLECKNIAKLIAILRRGKYKRCKYILQLLNGNSESEICQDYVEVLNEDEKRLVQLYRMIIEKTRAVIDIVGLDKIKVADIVKSAGRTANPFYAALVVGCGLAKGYQVVQKGELFLVKPQSNKS